CPEFCDQHVMCSHLGQSSSSTHRWLDVKSFLAGRLIEREQTPTPAIGANEDIGTATGFNSVNVGFGPNVPQRRLPLAQPPKRLIVRLAAKPRFGGVKGRASHA